MWISGTVRAPCAGDSLDMVGGIMVTWIGWAHARNFLVGRSGVTVGGWGGGADTCISTKFPGDSGAAGLRSKSEAVGLHDAFLSLHPNTPSGAGTAPGESRFHQVGGLSGVTTSPT